MIDENGKSEIDHLILSVHCAARRVIASFIICTVIIVSVFVHYANSLQEIGVAQELAITRQRVVDAIKERCGQILPLVESARLRNDSSEHPDPVIAKELDGIEKQANDILSPYFGILVDASGSSTIVKGFHD